MKIMYKDSVLYEGDDEHKTLRTEGKYLEDDIEIYNDGGGGLKKVSSLTGWNQEINAGSVTPSVTLPSPDTTKSEEIAYIFTAASANASFTAPSGYKLCTEDGTSGLSAANTIAFNSLTIGSVYEISFKPISSSIIRMIIVETTTA